MAGSAYQPTLREAPSELAVAADRRQKRSRLSAVRHDEGLTLRNSGDVLRKVRFELTDTDLHVTTIVGLSDHSKSP